MPTLTSARAERFHAYVERLSRALGHQDRHGPLRDYVTGLCLPGAYTGDREHPDRPIVNALIGDRDRSAATLAGRSAVELALLSP